MTNQSLAERLQQLLDRQEITNVLMLYSRGIDRKDKAALERVYWPDAIDDHGVQCGDARTFIDNVLPTLARMRTSHFLGNILIEFVSATVARSETYFIATHRIEETDGPINWILGGRYLDLFEKRGEEWRIKERTVVADYDRMAPVAPGWQGWQARSAVVGGPRPEDALYKGYEPGAFPLPGSVPYP